MVRFNHCLFTVGCVIAITSAGGYAHPDTTSASHAQATTTTAESRSAVQPNDNRRAAGSVDRDAVTIRLRAAKGAWRPEGANGPAVIVEAFGELNGPLTVPAPLIRVTEGKMIAVSIRNELEMPLRVNGLCARDGASCPPLDVPPGQLREIRFPSGPAGTYHYWATSLGAPVPFRELAGALVVDPRDGPLAPDRIFVITEWSDLTAAQLRAIVTADDANEAFLAARPRFMFVINGLSWPATERLQYRQGEIVRWRVINLSSQTHPMHLHGFYFRVTHAGNGLRDEPVNDGAGREVVTEVVRSGVCDFGVANLASGVVHEGFEGRAQAAFPRESLRRYPTRACRARPRRGESE